MFKHIGGGGIAPPRPSSPPSLNYATDVAMDVAPDTATDVARDIQTHMCTDVATDVAMVQATDVATEVPQM